MMRTIFKCKTRLCLASALAIAAFVAACTKQSEDVLKQEQGNVTCDTAGVQFTVDVLPIIEANCYSCHANGIVNGGVTLDGYTNIIKQVQNGNLIGAITHAPGFVPMPYDGGKLSDCNIAKIQAWIHAGAPDN
jgi:hypothetical protein